MIVEPITTSIAAAGVAAAAAQALRSFLDARRDREAVKVQEEVVHHLEVAVKQEQTLGEYVETLLETASERQRLAVLQSERRASNLFRVGTILMTLSVFVPFLLVAIYYQTDPVRELSRLQGLGINPEVAIQLAQRDWHLLVAGVSFGLLFLAAARGILAAENRQRDIYFHEYRVANYYSDLVRALKIAVRLDTDSGRQGAQATSDEAVRRIIVLLLERGSAVAAPRDGSAHALKQPDNGGDSELLRTIVESIKK